MTSLMMMAALSAVPCWDEAWVSGHMDDGDRLFYRPGEEMVFRLKLEGVKGGIPDNTYFFRWQREAADRAFAYIERGPLKDWNWDAQFEDVKPHPPYGALTHHMACSTAMYMLKRFPGDRIRLHQARELVRFAEDQFVYWETPCRADGTGVNKGSVEGVTGWRCDYLRWFCPGVGEQHGWEMPIDSAAAKVGETYLALYEVEGRRLDLEKARTLGDSMTRIQKADGSIRTQWLMRKDADNYWLSCMAYTITFLDHLAEKEADDGK